MYCIKDMARYKCIFFNSHQSYFSSVIEGSDIGPNHCYGLPLYCTLMHFELYGLSDIVSSTCFQERAIFMRPTQAGLGNTLSLGN
jgi:hypothetical protein